MRLRLSDEKNKQNCTRSNDFLFFDLCWTPLVSPLSWFVPASIAACFCCVRPRWVPGAAVPASAMDKKRPHSFFLKFFLSCVLFSYTARCETSARPDNNKTLRNADLLFSALTLSITPNLSQTRNEVFVAVAVRHRRVRLDKPVGLRALNRVPHNHVRDNVQADNNM